MYKRQADHRQPLPDAAHLRQQRADGAAIVMHQQQAVFGPARDQLGGILERLDMDGAARQAVRNRGAATDITIDEKKACSVAQGKSTPCWTSWLMPSKDCLDSGRELAPFRHTFRSEIDSLSGV